jgi:hypothetical protein
MKFPLKSKANPADNRCGLSSFRPAADGLSGKNRYPNGFWPEWKGLKPGRQGRLLMTVQGG